MSETGGHPGSPDRPADPAGGLPPYPGSAGDAGTGPPGSYPQGPPPGYPPTSAPPPGYPGAGYPGAGYPGPGYPPAGGAPPGYPPPGYPPPGYPSQSWPGAPYGSPAPTVPYASWIARVGGYLIDFVILAIVNSIVSAVLRNRGPHLIRFHYNQTVNGVTTVHHTSIGLWAFVIEILIVLLYGAILCGSSGGQTVGMMAVGARAIRADSGAPLGFWRALGRAAFEELLVLLLFIPWVVDMLWPLWDRQNQTLHDKISNTVVINKRAIGSGTGPGGAYDQTGYSPPGGYGQPGYGTPGYGAPGPGGPGYGSPGYGG